MTTADLMPRVEKGAAWLDAKYPGWWRRVNLDKLQLHNCNVCVLGQGTPDYDVALGELYDDFKCHGSAVGGFNLKPYQSDSGHPDWQTLRECWITAILARRFAESESPALVSEGQADKGVTV